MLQLPGLAPACPGEYRTVPERALPAPPCRFMKPPASSANLNIMDCVAVQPEVTVPIGRTGRIPALDSLRGFLLVWMTLTHLPTRVSAYSNQALGYVSAAEGFILLAAVLTGRIQRHATQKYGPRIALRKLLQRGFRVYAYHLGLLAVAFGICAAVAVYLHREPLQYLLDFFIARPKIALAAAPVLLYNPPLLDILPMYVVFILLTPLILRASARRGWAPVLFVSATIWLLAQFDVRAWIYSGVARWGFPIPLNELGAFDLFGWQFLWIGGLALGEARFPASWPKWIVGLCGVVAATLFICRHTAFADVTGPALFDVLVNKWRLSILRLVNAAALGVLLLRFGSPLADSRLGRNFGVLGRASLEVFSAHVLLCFLFLGLEPGPDVRFAPWQDAIIVTSALGVLWLVARRAADRRVSRAPAPVLRERRAH